MVDFSNLRLTDVFTRTGQPLSEAIGIRPEVTLAELARPDMNFAELARPFVPGNIDFIRPGVFNPGDIGPIDVGPIRPGRDPVQPTTAWPSVGIPADVRPGDLIQAAAWNALLAWVRALAAGATQAVPIQTPVVVPPVVAPPVAAPPVAAPPSATTRPPITFDPGRIPDLQPVPIPRPPEIDPGRFEIPDPRVLPIDPGRFEVPDPRILPTPPVDITPFERLLLQPEIRRVILADPATVERIATLPALGDALVAHPEILTGLASTPSVATQPEAAPPAVAEPSVAESIAASPTADVRVATGPAAEVRTGGLTAVDAATVVERLSVDPAMGRVLEQPALRMALGIDSAAAVDTARVADQPVAPARTTRTRVRTTRTAGPG